MGRTEPPKALSFLHVRPRHLRDYYPPVHFGGRRHARYRPGRVVGFAEIATASATPKPAAATSVPTADESAVEPNVPEPTYGIRLSGLTSSLPPGPVRFAHLASLHVATATLPFRVRPSGTTSLHSYDPVLVQRERDRFEG